VCGGFDVRSYIDGTEAYSGVYYPVPSSSITSPPGRTRRHTILRTTFRSRGLWRNDKRTGLTHIAHTVERSTTRQLYSDRQIYLPGGCMITSSIGPPHFSHCSCGPTDRSVLLIPVLLLLPPPTLMLLFVSFTYALCY